MRKLDVVIIEVRAVVTPAKRQRMRDAVDNAIERLFEDDLPDLVQGAESSVRYFTEEV